MKTSVQLYSLENNIKNEGFDAVLSGIKACGIDGVEIGENTFGLTFEEYRETIERHGLVIFGAHTGLATLAKHDLEWMRVVGFKQLIVAWLPLSAFRTDFKRITDILEEAALFYKKHGISVGYHNHAHEFDGDTDYIAKLLELAPSVGFEPDIAWLAAAGKSAVEYLKPYESRLLTVHLKEFSAQGAEANNPVFGKGISEIKECAVLSKRLKLEHVVIEFENIEIPWREYLESAAEYVSNAKKGL